jgi:glycerophosphoryl diester phosphodiesterase
MKKILVAVIFISGTLILGKPLIIGHRGASGYEPENTLRSFARAVQMGADMIELDVFLCKSGEIVVIHDEKVERTTNGNGSVKKMSLAELKKLDAGKGERIPLLSEVFDLVDKRIKINIEIKDSNAPKAVACLISEYVKNKGWSYDHFLVSSFDHDAIQKFYVYCPQVKTGALFNWYSLRFVHKTKRAHADFAILDCRSVTRRRINHLHECDLSVYTYTVNNSATARQLASMGIDGIITNYPDILEKRDGAI